MKSFNYRKLPQKTLRLDIAKKLKLQINTASKYCKLDLANRAPSKRKKFSL